MASNLPKTFKAYFYEKVDQPMVLRDVDLKMPEEGELLLKISACGVCRSDEMVKEGQMVQLYAFCNTNRKNEALLSTLFCLCRVQSP